MRYLFTNCNIIRTSPIQTIENNMAILINNGKFENICGMNDLNFSGDRKNVDLHGKYITPGFINAHTHLFGSGKPSKSFSDKASKERLLKILNTSLGKLILMNMMKKHVVLELLSGVTTLRSMGDFHYLDVKLKNNNKGCTIIPSGRGITVSDGHACEYANIGNSESELRECVKKCLENGAEFIKIFSTGGILENNPNSERKMSIGQMESICDEAHKNGKMVGSHVICKEGVREALLAGVDTIEHGAELDNEIVALFKNNPKSLRGYSALVPTIYPAAILSRLDTQISKISDLQKNKVAEALEQMISGYKKALAENVKIGLGNDASVPFVTHNDFWRELECRVNLCGIKPIDAIHQATALNSEILGIDDVTGSIDIGKRADFLAFSDDPTQNIKCLATPFLVVANGKIVKR